MSVAEILHSGYSTGLQKGPLPVLGELGGPASSTADSVMHPGAQGACVFRQAYMITFLYIMYQLLLQIFTSNTPYYTLLK